MYSFDHIISTHRDAFPVPDLRGLQPHETRSYLAIVARIWAVTILILALPPAVIAVGWAILRS